MAKEADNKFTWVIKSFSSLQSKTISSETFVIGNCKWRLLAYPKGFNKPDYFSLFLEVADYKSLPPGWKRHARCLVTIVNHNSEKGSKRNEGKGWFNQKNPGSGLSTMLLLTKLHDKDGGFLVNDELTIVAEVDVFEVIGELDVLKESEAVIQPMNVDDAMDSNELLKEVSPVKETIEVNGFEVLPSEVVLVRRIFEKHPGIALEFRPKNPHLKTACMYLLLSLIEALSKSMQDLSKDDLLEADIALTYLKNSGLKVDWLEEKMEEVKEKKKEEESGQIRMQELERELKEFKQKCSEFKQKCLDIEALLEKEKAKVFAARAHALTLDDVV